ncbi:hypothetical protein MTO96_048583 [Rhipicephalus appendiculatus]
MRGLTKVLTYSERRWRMPHRDVGRGVGGLETFPRRRCNPGRPPRPRCAMYKQQQPSDDHATEGKAGQPPSGARDIRGSARLLANSKWRRRTPPCDLECGVRRCPVEPKGGDNGEARIRTLTPPTRGVVIVSQAWSGFASPQKGRRCRPTNIVRLGKRWCRGRVPAFRTKVRRPQNRSTGLSPEQQVTQPAATLKHDR